MKARCVHALLFALTVFGASVRGDDWKLVWADEFNTEGAPDPARWDYEEGFLRNHEKQYYTRNDRRNARVENGRLVIEALKEHRTDLPRAGGRGRAAGRRTETDYTSASLVTRGKAEWTNAKIEVRAKLPTGRGVWPAIWTLGVNIDRVGWPRCGEIDIMENVGFDPDVIHANIHTEKYNHVRKTNKGAQMTLARPYDDFHVYAVAWDDSRMEFSVDGRKYFTYENEHTGKAAWPFDDPQYLILNLAIGGDWGGRKGIDDAIFPQRMEVDYVRVYQRTRPPAR